MFFQIKVLQSQVADMKTASVDRRHLEIPTQDELEDIRREYIRKLFTFSDFPQLFVKYSHYLSFLVFPILWDKESDNEEFFWRHCSHFRNMISFIR